MSTTDEILINAHRIRQLENDLFYARGTINQLMLMENELLKELTVLRERQKDYDNLVKHVEFYQKTDDRAAERRNQVEMHEFKLREREFWINVREIGCFLAWCGLFMWVMYVR